MLSELLFIDHILISFESVLKIEYEERDTQKIIQSAIGLLENAYGVKLDDDIYKIQAKNMLVSDTINVLLQQVMECLKELSLYIDINMFNRSIAISLADVNYLGFAKEEIVTALKYLQDKDLYEQRSQLIPPITAAVSNIDVSEIKRLFVIMLVLERLGIKEGVTVVARLLYLGGLIL